MIMKSEDKTNDYNMEVYEMAKYKCMMCGYVYDEAKGDPDNGIPAGTKWEDLPSNYACPVCASPKGQFKKIED